MLGTIQIDDTSQKMGGTQFRTGKKLESQGGLQVGNFLSIIRNRCYDYNYTAQFRKCKPEFALSSGLSRLPALAITEIHRICDYTFASCKR